MTCECINICIYDDREKEVGERGGGVTQQTTCVCVYLCACVRIEEERKGERGRERGRQKITRRAIVVVETD